MGLVWKYSDSCAQRMVSRRFARRPLERERQALRALGPSYPPPHLDVDVVVISNRPLMAKKAAKSLKICRTSFLDGSDFESFSELANAAVQSVDSRFVVVLGDKCYPTDSDIFAAVRLLERGFGLVSLFRFGCFVVDKAVFTYLGGFDEKFFGGQYEDQDFLLRLWEADIACWETEGIPYFALPSSWDSSYTRGYFEKKWKVGNPPIRSLARDISELRGERPQGLLRWKDGRIMAKHFWLGFPIPAASHHNFL